MKIRRLASILASAALLLSTQATALATSSATPQTLVIGVDHVDNANQQPGNHRVFEYTDFFSRNVTVHTGDTLNFQAAPASFHIVGLATNEEVARKVYPVALNDTGDPHLAIGTGLPKIVLGPSNVSITGGSTNGGGTFANNPNGPPVCGVPALGEENCKFSGGNDIEVAGPNPGFGQNGPASADWLININAPPGTYHFFCYIHPGMDGTLNVVAPGQGTTTQAQINAASNVQFKSDQAEGLAAESAANHVKFTGGLPGTRNYVVQVGAGAPDNRVAIDEMFPTQTLNLIPGDQVTYMWLDPHNVHSVTFPAEANFLPPPFGPDCGTTFNSGPPNGPPCNDPAEGTPEFIADPGNMASGSVLTSVGALFDAGVLIGKDYGVTPSAQSWSARVSAISAPGTYEYQCTVHDFMHGKITVSAH